MLPFKRLAAVAVSLVSLLHVNAQETHTVSFDNRLGMSVHV